MDCGKLKRLPSKKTRVSEPSSASSHIHWKLFLGWLAIIVLDSLANFRFEYLYPVFMFVRSVYDSYKYQGLLFALMFICLVVYLDLLCATVLTGPWLFLSASSCVWWEIMRNTDHTFSYSALTLWMLFLYIEVSHRLQNLPQDLSRPFAAHCIGYPVVTMSFLVKHQITHIIRQRQQKHVTEENAVFFDVLQKALPPAVDGAEDPTPPPNSKSAAALPTAVDDVANSHTSHGDHKTRISPKATSKNSSHKSHSSSSTSKHSRPPSAQKSHDKVPSTKNSDQIQATPPPPVVANGDLHLARPSSAGKVHLPTGKKQATVKAVPRSEPPLSPAGIDKQYRAQESLQAELKQTLQAKTDAECTVSQLELEIKKLKADLHASCLQEEETSLRVDQLMALEKSHKAELQRLRAESENLQHKLAKVSSSRQQDQSLITDLEKHLKHETESRSRAEANLREHRNLVRHSWSEEEVKEFKDKLLAKERELESVRKDLHKKERAFDNLSKELAAKRSAVRGLEEELKQMKASLADETRVKIELFTALSEARRKHQEELRIKSAEINKLRQNLAEIIAIMPVPTTSSGSVLGGGATLPFSSSATTPTSSPQQQQLH